jgi:hypothetical protein
LDGATAESLAAQRETLQVINRTFRLLDRPHSTDSTMSVPRAGKSR